MRIQVTKPIAVAWFEVTYAEWDACLADCRCDHECYDNGWGRGNPPLINATNYDITEKYLSWLSHKTHHNYRLKPNGNTSRGLERERRSGGERRSHRTKRTIAKLMSTVAADQNTHIASERFRLIVLGRILGAFKTLTAMCGNGPRII